MTIRRIFKNTGLDSIKYRTYAYGLQKIMNLKRYKSVRKCKHFLPFSAMLGIIVSY